MSEKIGLMSHKQMRLLAKMSEIFIQSDFFFYKTDITSISGTPFNPFQSCKKYFNSGIVSRLN